jgi:hypothetical protein
VTLLKCDPLPDQTAVSSTDSWVSSFANIQCYDSLKGRTSRRRSARRPDSRTIPALRAVWRFEESAGQLIILLLVCIGNRIALRGAGEGAPGGVDFPPNVLALGRTTAAVGLTVDSRSESIDQ